MFTAEKYDKADRIIFMDDSAINSEGKPILRFLPFSVVIIEGREYIEMHSELPSANDGVFPDQQVFQVTMPQRFTRIQSADKDNPRSYNPSDFQPVFEKHGGV